MAMREPHGILISAPILVALTFALGLSACGGQELELEAASPPRAQGSDYSVLLEPRTQADAIPRRGTNKLRDDPAVVRAGVRWDDARITTSRNGFDVFVVPAKRGVCMAVRGADTGTSLTCAKDAADGVRSRIGVANGFLLVGIAPDGMRDLSLSIDSRSTRVPIERNGVAEVYARYLSVVLDEPAVEMLLTFGLSDRYTWLQEDMPRGDGAPRRPLPFDENLQPKPAYSALVQAFAKAPSRSPLR